MYNKLPLWRLLTSQGHRVAAESRLTLKPEWSSGALPAKVFPVARLLRQSSMTSLLLGIAAEDTRYSSRRYQVSEIYNKLPLWRLLTPQGHRVAVESRLTLKPEWSSGALSAKVFAVCTESWLAVMVRGSRQSKHFLNQEDQEKVSIGSPDYAVYIVYEIG
ncbi:hypothetical protein J6590_031076 [Homalodisca vitripennis]|nr:hypothetical protein J6590_031076 [Homalodisca vitripennis]